MLNIFSPFVRPFLQTTEAFSSLFTGEAISKPPLRPYLPPVLTAGPAGEIRIERLFSPSFLCTTLSGVIPRPDDERLSCLFLVSTSLSAFDFFL